MSFIEQTDEELRAKLQRAAPPGCVWCDEDDLPGIPATHMFADGTQICEGCAEWLYEDEAFPLEAVTNHHPDTTADHIEAEHGALSDEDRASIEGG